ncbi:hypothetical protein [Luteibacter yeojuensis]|uniref:Peptidase C13 n=1 Tax=Luteibacter yeojuensis TaxID=345309 RepID=A0A0F3KJX1_9GAMM|nr:hypothetical protein [Luteibacter yeojuensis]KJV30409.1 hypothetical protein VI08_14955 [Luteibacter yeojuensis]
MLLALFLAFAGAGPAAAADGFNARVQAAKALEQKPDGKAWQAKLWDTIGNPATDALKGCIASNAPADKRAFSLVAKVDGQGRSTEVAVSPATPVANCFAGQFANWALPMPPKAPAPYPIEIDVSMD